MNPMITGKDLSLFIVFTCLRMHAEFGVGLVFVLCFKSLRAWVVLRLEACYGPCLCHTVCTLTVSVRVSSQFIWCGYVALATVLLLIWDSDTAEASGYEPSSHPAH